jgi:hypothetical protein
MHNSFNGLVTTASIYSTSHYSAAISKTSSPGYLAIQQFLEMRYQRDIHRQLALFPDFRWVSPLLKLVTV